MFDRITPTNRAIILANVGVFLLQLLGLGLDQHLANGLNVHQGAITHEAVARDLGLPYRAYNARSAAAA